MNNLLRWRDGVAELDREDRWTWIDTAETQWGEGPLLLPLAQWLQEASSEHGVWLGPDDPVDSLTPWLAQLPLIALQFPDFRDGRAYSQAYLLRTRLGWTGELRAIGDVLRDQLSHMRQCGFDAFAVRADKCPEDALKGLAGMSVVYGRSVIEPRPLFRRRG